MQVNKAIVLLGLVGIVVWGTAAQDEPPPEGTEDLLPGWRFGVIESTQSPDEADSLGVGWTRLIFHWAELQPDGPDDWRPEIGFEQLEREMAAEAMVGPYR